MTWRSPRYRTPEQFSGRPGSRMSGAGGRPTRWAACRGRRSGGCRPRSPRRWPRRAAPAGCGRCPRLEPIQMPVPSGVIDHGIHAHRVVRAVELRRRSAACPVSLSHRGQLDVAVGCQRRARTGRRGGWSASPSDLAGILGEQRQLTCGDVELVGVHPRRSALVQSDTSALPGSSGSSSNGHVTPGNGVRSTAAASGFVEIDPVDVPVLVAVGVLHVQQPARIVGPGEDAARCGSRRR